MQVQNALRLLRPGGHLCVCDFTVLPDRGQSQIMSSFWKRIFATDHVLLNEEHRQYLKDVTMEKFEETGFGGLPYVPPMLRAGWYAYIGVKMPH